MKIFTFYITIIVLFFSNALYSQDTIISYRGYNKYSFSIAGGLSQVFNKTTLPLIPGADDCGVFEDGDGTGYYFGIRFGYEFVKDIFEAEVGLIYENRPVALQANTSSYQVLSPISNKYEDFVLAHDYSGNLQYIDFEFAISAKLSTKYPFKIKLGFGIGNPLAGTNYENYEQIVSPQGVLFPDETLRRVVGSGKIESAGTNFGVIGGISYPVKLKENILLSPEIQYRYGINSVLSDADWKTNIIRFGLALSYKFGIKTIKPIKKEPVKEPEVVIPIEEKPIAKVIPEKKYIIDTALISTINIQQTTITQTYPILPYIFFDSARAEIKNIYLTTDLKSEFNEKNLPQDNLGIYYKILDLIGYRMKSNSKFVLNINGVTDGYELNTVLERLKLAEFRAKAISEYLNKNWEIDKKRLITKIQEQPDLATNIEYDEGFAENRRVELSSNFSELFDPVSHSRFLEYATNSQKIAINPKYNSIEKIKYLSLIISNEETIFTSKNFTDNYEHLEIDIDKNLLSKIGSSITQGKGMKLILQVVDEKNTVESKEFPITVDLQKNDFELGRLNLIVFDFDKSELSKFNQDLIKKFTQNSVKSESEINIIGSTDRLGELDYNLRLSKSRAENVSGFMKNIFPSAIILKTEGIGSSQLKYDNNLPEGRFYSRTVLIEVKTSIK